jgi:hypothetical protein
MPRGASKARLEGRSEVAAAARIDNSLTNGPEYCSLFVLQRRDERRPRVKGALPAAPIEEEGLATRGNGRKLLKNLESSAEK